jgi:CRP-like cAMP-binding protein
VSTVASKIKQLRAEALELILSGEPRKALEKLAKLESLDPKEPDWPRRAAECHRLLGERPECLSALARAADGYVCAGMVVKAMAICKMMLAINPQHPAALDWMRRLDRPLGMAAAAERPGLQLPVIKKRAAPAEPTAGPPEPTGPEPTRATGTLVRKLATERGLVAVARAAGRKPGPTTKAPDTQAIAVEPPRAPAHAPAPPLAPAPASRSSRSSGNWQVVDDAVLLGPETPSGPPDISLPPLSIKAELHSLVPNSRPLLGHKGTPSGMFRLAIDPAPAAIDITPPTRGEQTLRQARLVLPAIPLFSEIDPSSLEGLVRQSHLMHLEAGEVAFRQYDPPDCLYVVVNGSVEVIDDAASDAVLYRLTENEFFGEAALISDEPHPATVRASEACDLIAFDRDAMRACIAKNPSVVPILLRFLRGRMLEHLLRTNLLFVGLDTAQRRALSRRFEFIEVAEGAILISQGTRSPGLFVLLSGAVDVIRSEGVREHWLATLERGGVFGEISLLTRPVAIADVRCALPGFALMLPASDFEEVTTAYPPMLEALSRLSVARERAYEGRSLSR